MSWRLTRRRFLGNAAGAGISLTSPAWLALDAFAGDSARRGHLKEVDPAFYTKLSGRRTQCFVCPLDCILKPGQTCFCRTRRNHDGTLNSHAYGNPCILSVDPIEKLPLHHYLPGRRTLSLAVGGCNLRCLYCQNWSQSQVRPDELTNFDLPVGRALDGAARKEIDLLAYTYTEPIAFFEYMEDLAAAGRARGVRSVCATALYVKEKPLRRLCRNVEAFAVALKGFDEEFYREVLGSSLGPVLRALEVLKDEKVWFEIVTLIVPTYNDDVKQIEAMCRWIVKTLGRDVPLHFGRFVPQYRLKDLPPTPVATLERCRKAAFDTGLRHVYVFNVAPHEGNHTYCHGCGQKLVRRLGFKILANDVRAGACPHCGTGLPGVWSV
ncbi:MAG: AmmeMemoRadiSam system radical SAM enzyme [Planctomycetota bacterium]|jgi:pyruvate formate lyase activating enzyme